MAEGKCLVVYYSRTGTTEKVAREIAEGLGCELEAIVDRKSRSGARGYIASLKDAALGTEADIEPPQKDPGAYELVVLGTPVWAWSMASPMRAYLRRNGGKLRRVAFFATTGGTGLDRTFRHMRELCGKAPVATLGLRMREVQQGAYAGALRAFLDKLRA